MISLVCRLSGFLSRCMHWARGWARCCFSILSVTGTTFSARHSKFGSRSSCTTWDGDFIHNHRANWNRSAYRWHPATASQFCINWTTDMKWCTCHQTFIENRVCAFVYTVRIVYSRTLSNSFNPKPFNTPLESFIPRLLCLSSCKTAQILERIISNTADW